MRNGITRAAEGALLAMTMLSLAGCGTGADTESAEAATAEAGGTGAYTRIINVEVTELRRESFTEIIRLTGVVKADRDVPVAAEEGGVVEEVYLDKGARVRQGQAIVRLNADVLEAQVAQARAQASLAEETWQRRKRLWEEDRVGAEIAYLEARYAAEQARANLQVLEERLARTVVRAPIEGVLDDRYVEVGNMVSAGTPVARIVDLHPAKIQAGVPERYALDVEAGTTARVTVDVLPGEVSEGRIAYVGAAVDPGSRTFPVEFEVANQDGRIKPEMVATMVLERRTLDEVLVIPQEALIRVEEGFVTFIVGEDGATARVRPVVLGPSQRNQVVVLEGLEAGDRLVVNGQNALADGDRIKVVGERNAGGGGDR